MACSAASPATQPSALSEGATANQITGDYVEVRTVSVFAGACHYNGEMLPGGRDALLAIDFTKGTWKGVDLSGVRIAAEVSGADNLANTDASRKCELAIDKSASDVQVGAIVDLLEIKDHDALGADRFKRGDWPFRSRTKSDPIP